MLIKVVGVDILVFSLSQLSIMLSVVFFVGSFCKPEEVPFYC